MRINNNNQKGVTLVEVMVSIFLFGVALGSLLFLLTRTLTNADELRANTVAAGLAQEGLEVVRNIRDQNRINSLDFDAGLPNGTYEVQWDSVSLTSGSARRLRKDPSTGVFSYDRGNETFFQRTLTISTVPPVGGGPPYEKMVTVSVTWRASDGNTRKLNAESHLYDWY